MSSWLEGVDDWFIRQGYRWEIRRLMRTANAILDRTHDVQHYSKENINQESRKLQMQLQRSPRDAAYLGIDAFAIAALACKQILGIEPNATQIVAAILTAAGNVVELRSGEGKTAVAMLAAYW